MRKLLFVLLLLMPYLLLLSSTPQVRADNVPAGFDLFETESESTVFHFRDEFTIPPDFFDPGSDPFAGDVGLEGEPITVFQSEDTGTADTVVRRDREAMLPSIGDSDTIPIELVMLSLTSAAPITVTYNGGINPELWDLDATVSPSRPSTGRMTITHSDPGGGTFSSEFIVQPLFTFTRQTDGSVRQLDVGQVNLPPQAVEDLTLRASAPWVHRCPDEVLVVQGLNDNFCAGATAAGKVLTVEQARLAQHGVLPAQPAHYKCYLIQPPFPPNVQVNLRDQFHDELGVKVRDPRVLCAPVSKIKTDDPTRIPLPPPKRPHLKCYDIEPHSFVNVQVRLKDQFHTENVRVRESQLLCVPVSKVVTDIADLAPPKPPPRPHVKCYSIEPQQAPNVKVNLRDQFHIETGVLVESSAFLCAPVSKIVTNDPALIPPSPPPAPHVKCYTITGPPINVNVNLRDQFHVESVKVLDPVLLCTQVKKEIIPVVVGGVSSSSDSLALMAPYIVITIAVIAIGMISTKKYWFRTVNR